MTEPSFKQMTETRAGLNEDLSYVSKRIERIKERLVGVFAFTKRDATPPIRKLIELHTDITSLLETLITLSEASGDEELVEGLRKKHSKMEESWKEMSGGKRELTPDNVATNLKEHMDVIKIISRSLSDTRDMTLGAQNPLLMENLKEALRVPEKKRKRRKKHAGKERGKGS